MTRPFRMKLATKVVHNIKGISNTKQKHLGCKKGEANQKQQLSDYMQMYMYIAILATKNFDIRLRPRIS